MALTTAGALLAVAGTSTALSVVEQRQARKESQRASRIRRRREAAENLRARQRALAERIRAQAAAQQAGVTTGVGAGASSVQAEVASVGAQFGANVGLASMIEQSSLQEAKALESVAERQQRAQTFGAIGDVSLMFAAQTKPLTKG